MRSLIILRGLPGSGKSTFAAILASDSDWPVYAIDDYFTDPQSKEYSFRFAENHLAYKQCLDKTETAMKVQLEKIIIDNTFTMLWEMEPYFKLAEVYQYRVFVLTVENYHDGLNQHGIADEQLQKMAAKYKVKLL